MRAKTVILLAFGLALWTAGCVRPGDFVRPSWDFRQLGKTTYTEIVARFGRPNSERTNLESKQTVKTISYWYAGTISYGRPANDRIIEFHFVDLVLVGYKFASTFKEDDTNFDETKISEIKKGETTQAQVIRLMGQPTGESIFPLVQRKEKQNLVYWYQQRRNVQREGDWIGWSSEWRHYRKVLIVTVGENGVVTDVTFSESGKK